VWHEDRASLRDMDERRYVEPNDGEANAARNRRRNPSAPHLINSLPRRVGQAFSLPGASVRSANAASGCSGSHGEGAYRAILGRA